MGWGVNIVQELRDKVTRQYMQTGREIETIYLTDALFVEFIDETTKYLDHGLADIRADLRHAKEITFNMCCGPVKIIRRSNVDMPIELLP